uniref:uncharacterized protein LOC117611016 n=1 Tax=Osmia lignaria TaxID=473952 RepID=UPI0014791349|nr:uncharacterized protein LOC117611016 [Osmia lignaria]
MDCCTTEEEVVVAVKGKLPGYDGPLVLRLTRPNKAEQRMTILTVSEDAANKLLEQSHLRVGWVNCRIRRRKQITRCFRCLGYSHERRGCKGPHRSTMCFKCGNLEHKAADCTASPKCFLCADVNTDPDTRKHLAGSGECRVFREALAKSGTS